MQRVTAWAGDERVRGCAWACVRACLRGGGVEEVREGGGSRGPLREEDDAGSAWRARA